MEQANLEQEILPLDNPQFPSYFRLYQHEIRHLLFDHRSAYYRQFGHFFKEDELVPGGTQTWSQYFSFAVQAIENPVNTYIRMSEAVSTPLRRKEPTEAEKQREVARLRKTAEQRATDFKDSVIDTVLSFLLFSPEVMKYLDNAVKSLDKRLWDKIHLCGLNYHDPGMKLFFSRFSTSKEPDLPDKVAATFDPGYVTEKMLTVKNSNLLESCRPDIDKIDPKHRQIWARKVLREIPFSKEVNDDWFFNLVGYCTNDPYNRAMLNFLLPDFEQILAERELAVKRARNVGGRAYDNDQAIENEVTEMRLQKDYAEEMKGYNEGYSDMPSSPDEIRLRPYQEELVENAIAGKNTVICAPTGAGKTEVCIYVAFNHMLEREAKQLPSRVVMVVPKIPLVFQQEQRFVKYLATHKQTAGLSGQDGLHGKRKSIFLGADVVIMTPQILVDMLKSVRQDDRVYLCDISLLILDEVHHCDKDHPYMQLMNIWHEYKHKDKRPQVMGLTASLLIGKNNPSLESSMDRIIELLANVGATSLSIVRKHKDSLERYVPKPDEEHKQLSRPKDEFHINLCALLSAIYRYIKPELKKLTEKNDYGIKLSKKDATIFDGRISIPHASPELIQSRVQEFLGKVRLIPNGDYKFKPTVACMYIMAIAQAIQINGLMPNAITFEFLVNELYRLISLYPNSQVFYDIFEKHKEDLLTSADKGQEKEIVKTLIDILQEQFSRDKGSQCIIFVNERSTASKLCAFLNKKRVLGGPNDFGFVTSATSGLKNYGQSKESQRQTLHDFAHGRIKCVVATNVLEEGLDVKSCNLIIKYNTASSVVGRIQKSGRARAEGSRSIFLCLDEGIAKSEYEALIQENHLKICLDQIGNQGPLVLRRKVDDRISRNERTREMAKKEEDSKRETLKNEHYDMLCSVCNALVTDSDFIRKIGSHYVCVDPKVWLHTRIKIKTKDTNYVDANSMTLGQLHCLGNGVDINDLTGINDEKGCGHPMGKVLRFAGTYLPILTAKAFTYRKKHQNVVQGAEELESHNSWTAVSQKFFIPEATELDLKHMLNALSEASAIQAQMKNELDKKGDRMLKNAARVAEDKVRERERRERNRKAPKEEWIIDEEEEELIKKSKEYNVHVDEKPEWEDDYLSSEEESDD